MEKKDFIDSVRKLTAGYTPNAAALQQLSQVDLVALIGPTGVGKSSIIEKLELPYVKSDVSRGPRGSEKDGREYNFREDYGKILEEIKAGEYAQFLVSHSGEFYGTRVSSYPTSGTAIMAIIAGAVNSFRALGFRQIIPIYILPPSYIEWMHRIGSGRATDISSRMLEARESLPIAMSDPTYHFVLNDDLELAISEVRTIIGGGQISDHRNSLAHDCADLLFGRLGIDDSLLNE